MVPYTLSLFVNKPFLGSVMVIVEEGKYRGDAG